MQSVLRPKEKEEKEKVVPWITSFADFGISGRNFGCPGQSDDHKTFPQGIMQRKRVNCRLKEYDLKWTEKCGCEKYCKFEEDFDL